MRFAVEYPRATSVTSDRSEPGTAFRVDESYGIQDWANARRDWKKASRPLDNRAGCDQGGSANSEKDDERGRKSQFQRAALS